MLTLPGNVRIYLCAEPTDMRKGFDGLSATTREVIRQDPLSGHLFVFINRRKDRLKVLLWDTNGFLLLYKRLERGAFHLPTEPPPGQRHITLRARELAALLGGIDLRGLKPVDEWNPLEEVG